MKYLGIDFGLRRIGLATSEGDFASKLKTIDVKNFKDAVEKIVPLAEQGNFNKIIVGLPEGKIGQTVIGFVNALRKSGLDVATADETLSSQRAMLRMIESSVSKSKRRVIDDTAAAIILQDYLDNQ